MILAVLSLSHNSRMITAPEGNIPNTPVIMPHSCGLITLQNITLQPDFRG